jgi:ribosomal-protein-alanine N-acetyltransferase
MSLETAFQTFPKLETPNLILRQLTPADAQAFFTILGDPRVARYYDDDTFTLLSQAVEQLEAWEIGYRARRLIRWGITRRGDDTLLGTCGLSGIHAWHRRAAVGYELVPLHWRQGIMTETLTALLAFAFGDLDLNRIDALVMPANTPSILLLQKLGFSNEGLLREYENWGEEKGFTDLYMFSLLKKEWVASSR